MVEGVIEALIEIRAGGLAEKIIEQWIEAMIEGVMEIDWLF